VAFHCPINGVNVPANLIRRGDVPFLRDSNLLDDFPGTAVPGYRLLRPQGLNDRLFSCLSV